MTLCAQQADALVHLHQQGRSDLMQMSHLDFEQPHRVLIGHMLFGEMLNI